MQINQVTEAKKVTPPLDKAKQVEAQKAAKAPKKEEEKESDKKDVSTEEASQVVSELNTLFKDRDLRFVILDPNQVNSHNVVIEIREGERVVAQIPSKEMLKLAEAIKNSHLTEDDVKGLGLTDQKV